MRFQASIRHLLLMGGLLYLITVFRDQNSDYFLCLVVHSCPRDQKVCKLYWNLVQINIFIFFAIRDKRAFVLLVLRYSVILTAVCVQKILISVAVAAIFFPPFPVGHARYCTCKDYISLWISCYKYLHLAGEELG